jgi:competence protein ComFB
MEIHNTTEDIVFAKVTEIFDAAAKDKDSIFCTCEQCRMDAACYVLNRVEPRYVVSNRGVARIQRDAIGYQQLEADVVSLAYDGIKRVNHNQRPNFQHSSGPGQPLIEKNSPVYNIPTIIGRLFNGSDFAPIVDGRAELRLNGELAAMRNGNWQNPYVLVDKTEGTFTFWPMPVPAEAVSAPKIFEFSLRVEAPGLEPLNHFFQIPVTSEAQATASYSLDRTFKLPSLYMFPPGAEGDDF